MSDRDYLSRYCGFRTQRAADEMSTPWARGPPYSGAEAVTTADVRSAPSQMYGNHNIDAFAVGMQPPQLHTSPLLSHSHKMMAVLGLQPLSPTPFTHPHQQHHHHQLHQQQSHQQPQEQRDNVLASHSIDDVQATASAIAQEVCDDVPINMTKTGRGKKRKGEPSQFKKFKNKVHREQGKEYTSSSGKVKKARSVQPIDCSKCRFHCSEKISEETRKAIHTLYWNLGSYERQRAFIAQHVDQNDVKTCKSKSSNRREVANSFFFTHNRKEHRVCKAFFTKTLDIGNKVIDYTLKKTEAGVYIGRDERGRRDPANKTSSQDLDFVKMHIGSFGASKKEGKNRRKYLSPDLNVGKMYNMYKAMCLEVNKKPVSLSVYRNVFKKDFKLSFSKPRREHCPNCNCENKGKKKTKDNSDHTITSNMPGSSSYHAFSVQVPKLVEDYS